MTRGGTSKRRQEALRKCVVSGQSAPAQGLVRFVLGPQGELVPDVTHRLPGRGIYVRSTREDIETAAKKGLFSRAARAKVAIPEGLCALVESLLARQLTGLISIARKAGEAVCGYEKVRQWLLEGQAVLLVQAYDGSARERARLTPPLGPQSLISCLSGQELGLAFGRERAIHAALATGGLDRRITDEAARLTGMRGNASLGGDGRDDNSTLAAGAAGGKIAAKKEAKSA